ncbi:eukaryotic mitochondrial regulator protein-domain-containing protein [Xylaria bambusicola]|uniref:eukaryotic mitochondrial regulator protein-domain-containing protein n=1 Tax=Xylaria bambusicola TaxID=326684 RepID=UPI002007B461|nr:eukaryotic mitochondrial regulator protein-domain-containing protein [Xylaria bambusicola]KAI0506187.1 eukaryotic mitochondrial regulator protein-domain-containing protein [Xylaria bambusicola]
MPPIILTPSAAAGAIASSIIRTGIGAACRSTQSLQAPVAAAAASFSTTASRPKFSKGRRMFREWERRQGRYFRRHRGNEPVYLSSRNDQVSDVPFPLNPEFKSVKVLDERARELVWEKVMREGETIKAVSAELGIDIRRVAAIVRLKEVEKDWIAKDKPLATPYSKAVLSMLPTHYIQPNQQNAPYEPINEIHVHPYTMQQLFWPTSESRHFTREDAAEAFHPTLLSADKRVPHPELIQMEREVEQGRPLWDASERFKEAVMETERKAAEKQIAKAAYEEKKTTRVNTERFEFRFKQFNSENVGPKGRSRNVVGWRYGTPYDDRSKGHQIKIPTSVP